MLFNKTRQYNIHIFNKIIILQYWTKQIKAVANAKNNTRKNLHCEILLFNITLKYLFKIYILSKID